MLMGDIVGVNSRKNDTVPSSSCTYVHPVFNMSSHDERARRNGRITAVHFLKQRTEPYSRETKVPANERYTMHTISFTTKEC